METHPVLTITVVNRTGYQQLQEFPDLPDEEARELLAKVLNTAAYAARQALLKDAKHRIEHTARVEIWKHIDALKASEDANDKALDEAIQAHAAAK